VRDKLQQKLRAIEQELDMDCSGPLEKLLIRRISLSWLQAHHADLLVIQVGHENRGHTTYVCNWQRRAHLRLLAASKALATVRKLLPRGI
jgi:hypothetical protein